MQARSGWLCAPDSFKGTIGSIGAARCLAQGLHPLPARQLPMCDGGEGTGAALKAALGGSWEEVPLRSSSSGRAPDRGRWLNLGAGCAVVEFAEAAPFEAASPTSRPDPALGSSFPVGELLCSALESGAHTLYIGLGGSSTVDGGAGALQALGGVFRTSSGVLSRPVRGSDLGSLAALDLTAVRQRFEGVTCVLGADVRNPLLGPHGAVHQFGPQKGVRPDQLDAFEQGMLHFSRLLGDSGDQFGDGAAGGAGFGFRIGLNGRLDQGARLFGGLLGLQKACSAAEWVVTGEGRFDRQTPQGKVPWAVAECAKACGAKTALVAGSIAPDQLDRAKQVFDICLELGSLEAGSGATPLTPESALEEAGARLRALASQ